MIPIEEARSYVMDRCAPLAAIATEVADALGLVTAVDVTAKESLPPFAILRWMGSLSVLLT